MQQQLRNRHFERGVSITGLILGLAVFGGIGVLAMKVVPAYSEFNTIQKAMVTAQAVGGSVRDIQMSFDKQADVGYITAIGGKDLEIVKNANNGFDVSFAYEKKIPLYGPASILFEFAGTTAAPGAKPIKGVD